MPYVESFSEFAERHGGQAVSRIPGAEPSRMIFPSGAMVIRDHHLPEFPTLIEPPEEGTVANIKRRKLYWKTRTDQVVDTFQMAKHIFLDRYETLGQTVEWNATLWGDQPSGEVAILERLKEIVKENRAELRKVEKEYDEHPEVAKIREAEAKREAERQKQQEIQDEHQRKIAAVNI